MTKVNFNEKTQTELEAAKKQLEGEEGYEKPKEDTEGGSLTIPVTEEEEDEQEYVRPEKFKTEAELAKAYLELEKKLAGGKTEEKKVEDTDEVKDAVDRGVDFDALTEEYYTGGELSPDTYMDLAKKGYSKEVVDTFIEGRKAKDEAQLRELYEAAGGRESFETAVEWAKEHWPVDKIKAFNTIVASGDNESIAFAIESLMTTVKTSMSKNPNLLSTSPNSTSSRGTFKSMQEYIDAIKDPRYKRDPGYRKDIDEKLTRSPI